MSDFFLAFTNYIFKIFSFFIDFFIGLLEKFDFNQTNGDSLDDKYEYDDKERWFSKNNGEKNLFSKNDNEKSLFSKNDGLNKDKIITKNNSKNNSKINSKINSKNGIENNNINKNKKSNNSSLLSNFNFNQVFKSESFFEDLEKRYYDSEIFNVSPINSPLHFQSQSPESNGDKSNFLSGHKFNFIPKVLALLSKRGIVDLNSFNSILRLILVLAIGFLFIDFLIIAFISFELGIAALVSFFMILVFIFYYPHIKKENKYSSISKELPYALRHLSTELRAGKSLFDSLDSVATSDYGVLSEEFSRVLEEIKYGESTENAFLNLEKRVGSNALSRVIREILASLRVGSNLSNSLNIIAEDVNFDIRMKLKEYSEKLNAFIMIYTFLAILAPVIVLTMLLAASVVIGDLVPGDLVLILYGLFFPMIIIFLAFMIKKLEPKI